MRSTAVHETAEELALRLRRALGDRLSGAYLHGSAVLGGFVPGRSDLDLLVVVDRPLKAALRETVGQCLLRCDPSPAAGLESSVITEHTARAGGHVLDFELHIAHGHGESSVVEGGRHGPDPDLILHLAVCRQHGMPLAGSPAPASLVARVDGGLIVRQLVAELRWALDHAPEHYAVLNACRAWRFFEEGLLCSKLDAGPWALERGAEPDVVTAALAAQRGTTPAQPCRDHARDLVTGVMRLLEDQHTGRSPQQTTTQWTGPARHSARRRT